MRRILHVMLVAVAILVWVTNPVDARAKKIQTTFVPGSVKWAITGNQATRIEGTIASPKSKCIVGRAVDVQWSPNTTLQSPFGKGTTDAQGHFDVSGSAPVGSYYSIYIAKLTTGGTNCRVSANYGQFT